MGSKSTIISFVNIFSLVFLPYSIAGETFAEKNDVQETAPIAIPEEIKPKETRRPASLKKMIPAAPFGGDPLRYKSETVQNQKNRQTGSTVGRFFHLSFLSTIPSKKGRVSEIKILSWRQIIPSIPFAGDALIYKKGLAKGQEKGASDSSSDRFFHLSFLTMAPSKKMGSREKIRNLSWRKIIPSAPFAGDAFIYKTWAAKGQEKKPLNLSLDRFSSLSFLSADPFKKKGIGGKTKNISWEKILYAMPLAIDLSRYKLWVAKGEEKRPPDASPSRFSHLSFLSADPSKKRGIRKESSVDRPLATDLAPYKFWVAKEGGGRSSADSSPDPFSHLSFLSIDPFKKRGNRKEVALISWEKIIHAMPLANDLSRYKLWVAKGHEKRPLDASPDSFSHLSFLSIDPFKKRGNRKEVALISWEKIIHAMPLANDLSRYKLWVAKGHEKRPLDASPDSFSHLSFLSVDPFKKRGARKEMALISWEKIIYDMPLATDLSRYKLWVAKGHEKRPLDASPDSFSRLSFLSVDPFKKRGARKEMALISWEKIIYDMPLATDLSRYKLWVAKGHEKRPLDASKDPFSHLSFLSVDPLKKRGSRKEIAHISWETFIRSMPLATDLPRYKNWLVERDVERAAQKDPSIRGEELAAPYQSEKSLAVEDSTKLPPSSIAESGKKEDLKISSVLPEEIRESNQEVSAAEEKEEQKSSPEAHYPSSFHFLGQSPFLTEPRTLPKLANRQKKPLDPPCPAPCPAPCPLPSAPECLRLNSYLLAHGAFRYDRITNTMGVLFPNNYEMFDFELQAERLQIYETGVKGLAAFDPHWYLKASYYYGWIVNGHYSELFLRGNQKGNTQDAYGGFGYLSQINQNCALGFLGGWAFDEEITKLKDANEPGFDGLKFTSIWNGPWLGLDFYAQWSRSFLLNLGYEFHLADWRGSWILEEDSPLSNAFSDQRRGGLSFGQVVFGGFNWTGCHYWIGLEFKYQYFATQATGTMNASGPVPFNSAPISGPVSAVTFVKKTHWTSYGASLNLGYKF